MDQQDQPSLPQNTNFILPENPCDPTVEAYPAPAANTNPPAGVPYPQVQATADLALPYYPPEPSTVQFQVPFQMQGSDYFEQLVDAAEEFSVQQGDAEQLRFPPEDYPDRPLITFPQGPLTVEVGSIKLPLPMIGQNTSSVPATQTVVQALLRSKPNSMTQGAPTFPMLAQDTQSLPAVQLSVQAPNAPRTMSQQTRFSPEDHPDHPLITYPQGPLSIKVGSIAQPLPMIGQHPPSVPAKQTVIQALRLKLSSMTQGTPPFPTSAQDPLSIHAAQPNVQAPHEVRGVSRPSDIPAMPIVAQDVSTTAVEDSNEDPCGSQVESTSLVLPSA